MQIRIGTRDELADAEAVAHEIGLNGEDALLLAAILLHLHYVQGHADLHDAYTLLTTPNRTCHQILGSVLGAKHDPDLHYGWHDEGRPIPVNPHIAHIVSPLLDLPEPDLRARLQRLRFFL